MTDSEKRRIELLRRTRNLYSEKQVPPAVHPRYQTCYAKLYDSEKAELKTNSTFGLRIFISILLFALFVVNDYKEEKNTFVDSKKIVTEIQKQVDISSFDLL